MDFILTVLRHLPIIDLLGDLIGGTAPTSTGGILYDVIQLLGGLLVLAKGGNWVAERNSWERGEGFFKWILATIPRAIAWLSDLSAGNTRA